MRETDTVQSAKHSKCRNSTAFSREIKHGRKNQVTAGGKGVEMESLDSSSPTTTEGLDSARGKKKKKKGCTCKGFSSTSGSSSGKRGKKKFEGSVWFKERQIWANYIKRHSKDLKNAKPVVDDTAPKLNVASIYDVEVLKTIWGGLREYFNISQNIVKTLHETNILRGKTDTFTFDYSKPLSSNYALRKDFAKNVEKQNQIMVQMLKKSKTRMPTVKDYAEEWKKHEAMVESSSQFPLWWKLKKKEEAAEIPSPAHFFKQHVTEKSAKYPDKRPRVFFEISIRNVGVVGKMVAVLYSDYVPMTVKNFLAFCDPKAALTYKGNSFYLIFEKFYCQTGDVVENRGFGGTSIYGPYFGNEDVTLSHSERGILTMYSKIPNRNASQFLITFRKLESLDGQNVVFGKIVKGFHVLDAIESVGSKRTGRPKVDIYISDCDEI